MYKRQEMGSSASSVTTGKDLLEAAACIFLAIYLSLAGITLYNVTNVRWILSNEKNLMRACVVALPFLLVRITYTITVAFSNAGGPFYFRDVSVWAMAFMQFLMEAVVVCLFMAAGMTTPKMVKQELREGSLDVEGQKDIEMISGPTEGSARQQQGRPRFQKPQTIGDYRPSRLIRNALRS